MLYALIPAVSQETAISVAGAVAAWRRAGWALSLEGLPGEGCAIEKTLLLPTCCQRTAVGTAMCGILPTDVAQTVTAWDRTPGESKYWFDALTERGRGGGGRQTPETRSKNIVKNKKSFSFSLRLWRIIHINVTD